MKGSEPLLLLCKASADAVRQDIIRVLSTESFSVLELCRILDLPQPGISHHLKVLTNAGLLSTKREGNSIFYRRHSISQNDSYNDYTSSLFGAIDSNMQSELIKERLAGVYSHRAQNAKEFFKKNADKLKQNQNAIAEFDHYKACIEDILNHSSLNTTKIAMEIGPGESPLINVLAKKFDRVYALDNSDVMLNKTKQTIQPCLKKKVTLILDDLENITHINPELIVLNMVLHHIAAPSQFFKTAAERLSQTGQLLIIDLCQHHQDWAREICGDLWLGFEPAELDRWAQNANFKVDQSIYLGLKNGFQIQLKMFKKISH